MDGGWSPAGHDDCLWRTSGLSVERNWTGPAPPARATRLGRSGRLARWRCGVGCASWAAVAVALEGLPQGLHRGREVREFLQVQLAERFQLARPLVGEAQAHGAEVVGVLAAGEQSGLRCAIDQPDRAVVAQQEVGGNIAERRPARVGMAPNREQELVLSRCEAGRLRLPLAPTQEPAQAGAQL